MGGTLRGLWLLKERSRWDDSSSVQPVDLDSKSPTREEFSRDVHGRSVTSIKNYWRRQIFSGNKVPPPEVSEYSLKLEALPCWRHLPAEEYRQRIAGSRRCRASPAQSGIATRASSADPGVDLHDPNGVEHRSPG